MVKEYEKACFSMHALGVTVSEQILTALYMILGANNTLIVWKECARASLTAGLFLIIKGILLLTDHLGLSNNRNLHHPRTYLSLISVYSNQRFQSSRVEVIVED